MANFGLSTPYVAKLNPDTEKYSGGMRLGKAISTSVTPNYSTATLYADNSEAERVDEFVSAAVEVGVDRIPIAASETIFGHTIDESGKIVHKGNDAANYVGYGFWVASMEDGVKTYQGVVLHKVKFTEGQESFTTKGENIAFATPTLSGSATVLSNDVWRTLSPKFESISEAELWIKQQLNIELTYTEVTPKDGDNPKEEGWYELDGDDYVKTTDTSVEDGKTYYIAS